MSTWNDGYVSDIGYTYGYYPELSPQRAKLAFLENGLAFPEIGTACELGFGQGLSTNIHAAASTVSWWGTDFNPTQAAFAQDLANKAGTRAQLFDESFAEFANRQDLPDFDFIGLHGIWSWISDENRSVIVDFIRRKLRVGGVLYISYNTLPGWATFAPVRQLLVDHAHVMGSEGQGVVKRIDHAIEFLDQLFEQQPAFARSNPLVLERFKDLKKQDRHYLAHEYFNRDWHPMFFADMAKWLAPSKVQFACSANYLDLVDAINLTSEQQSFLKEISDPVFRQTTRDYMVNQQFRKDYWVKGPRTISLNEQLIELRSQRIMLLTPRDEISLKINGCLGEVTLIDRVYRPILDLLRNHNQMSLGELESNLNSQSISFAEIRQAVIVLVGAGHISCTQSSDAAEHCLSSSTRLNGQLIKKAHSSGAIQFLANPTTGGFINLNRFQQLFVSSVKNGKSLPAEWAVDVWNLVASQGQRLKKDGATLESPEENLAELTKQAQSFQEKTLPILKALKII